MHITELLSLFFVGIVGLFPIVNPFSTIPLFIALTDRMNDQQRKQIALRSSLYAGSIMFVFFFIGTLILSFLGISLDAVRAAGGLIITFIGFRMLFEVASSPSHDTPEQPHDHGTLDPSLVPLALPSMAGPGTLSVVMTGSAQVAKVTSLSERLLDYAIVFLIIATTTTGCWLVLRMSIPISRTLGSSGLEAFKKIMGFLLICLGVQFLANGILGFIHGTAPHLS